MSTPTLRLGVLGVALVCGQPPAPEATQAVVLADRTGDALAPPDYALSADGRWLVVATRHALVADDRNGLKDIYVFDRRSGRVTIESAGGDGLPSDGESATPAISRDGRFVVFTSSARNLPVAPGSPEAPRLYLKDRLTGTLTVVAGRAARPSISEDGHTIAYESTASAGAAATSAIDAPRICVVSRGSSVRVELREQAAVTGGAAPRPQAVSPVLDGAGRRLVFSAVGDPTGGIDTRDTNGVSDVYLRDLHTGVTTRLSGSPDGGTANGPSYHPSISTDGRYVVFASEATNLTRPPRSVHAQVYLHDTVTRLTRLVSRTAAARPGNGRSVRPVISRDGARIAFQTLATDLVQCRGCPARAADVNLLWDVLLLDVQAGSMQPVAGEIDTVTGSHGVVIDAEGTVVAYASRQPRDAADIGEDDDLFVIRWPPRPVSGRPAR